MPEVPKVVVITRTCNRPALLRRAMESVLAQTFSDWMHVVVNDGGLPEPVDALAGEFKKAYASRLKVIHQENQGMQQAANNGIKDSQSDFVVIHDDDDSWHPDYLAETTAFLEEKGPESPYQGVISKTLRILEEEQEDGSFKEVSREPYMPLKEISLFRIGYDNPFSPIAFLYRRSAHDVIGYFDPRWDMVADMDYNFKFLQQFEIGVVDKPLAYYHWRDDSATTANANTVTLQKERHGRYLNELKNHYFRQASNAREAAIALGLQVSAYAVENQWMTVEIRERMMELHLFLESISEKIQSIQSFNSDSLWPKLTDDVLERLDFVQKNLAEFDVIKRQLDSLQAYNADNTWPKLASLSKSLDDLRTYNADNTWPKLASLSKALDELRARIEEFQSANNEAYGNRLDNLQAFNSNSLWPKLVELQGTLEELKHFISEGLGPIVPEILQQIKPVKEFNDALWPKIEAFESNFQNLNRDISATWNKQVEGNAALEQLRQEVRALKEENKRQWQLGRLRLQWLPRVRKSDRDSTDEA